MKKSDQQLKDEILENEEEIEREFLFNNIHSCDEITHKDVWNPDWHECPLCGEKYDREGLMVHKTKNEMTH